MEWFIKPWILVSLAVVGAITLAAAVGYALYKLFLCVRQSILRHQKPKMFIRKDGAHKRVKRFPMTDAEFYSYMINLSPGELIRVEIRPDSKFRRIDFLVCKLAYFEEIEVKISDEISLNSKPEKNGFRNVITLTSGDKKVYWSVEVYEREVYRYLVETLDPSIAEEMLKKIEEEKQEVEEKD